MPAKRIIHLSGRGASNSFIAGSLMTLSSSSNSKTNKEAIATIRTIKSDLSAPEVNNAPEEITDRSHFENR